MAKVAYVTGGMGGIGTAICQRLAKEGFTVIAGCGPSRDWQKWLDEQKALGYTFHASVGNVADWQSTVDAFSKAKAEHGPIDVLVNNAGWDVFKPFTKTTAAEWDKLIAINLVGALHMLHAVLPIMATKGGGRVVNIASDAGRVGSSGEAVYAACKGGLISLSKTLAREHARHNITVNVICPGPTDTALLDGFKEGAANPEKLMEAFARAIPLGRIGQASDLAGSIAFMASDDAGFVTGQVLSVSGGLTMNG